MSLLEKHFITGFFSVQRLHGFRQVVTHVQSRQMLNCILPAGQSICRTPQKCRLWTSTQSRSCPSEKTDKKANQKQQSKNRQKTHNHNKTKTETTQRSGIATSNGNYMHDDILCVIMRMAQNKKQNRGTTKTPVGHVGGWEKLQSSMRKPGIPPARIPKITKSSSLLRPLNQQMAMCMR